MLTERILLKLSVGQMRDITAMAKRMKVPRSVYIRMALHYVTRMYPGDCKQGGTMKPESLVACAACHGKRHRG